ncbi:hypothetical protein [Roseibacillus persicicus]|uniref:hypothetical protein n=1 Tax=Roseibacillus persicicus TaxID=454148 RepID=UPI00280C5123|nr:hypothetical protein [Roseibacillus persicicus]MDQ8190596.1 hypothetical protein [Roseibacillus persicicus]
MKIIFLCGCLEPGQDGVGDYTRRLAGECIRQGHEAVMIALHDRKLQEERKFSWQASEEQEDSDTKIKCFRWSEKVSWRDRQEELVKAINSEKPDLVSIQFVLYSYNEKGIPFHFLKVVKRVARSVNTRWHIMFHELWLGIAKESKFREKVIGCIQEKVVMSLIICLGRPKIHTQCLQYYYTLCKKNLDVYYLPLFSNFDYDSSQALPKEISSALGSSFVTVHFGTFTNEISVLEDQFKKAMDKAGEEKRNVFFVGFGKGGGGEQAALQLAEKVFGVEQVMALGMVESTMISALINRADLAISRSNAVNWEKSGVVALFKASNLEVLFAPVRNKSLIELTTDSRSASKLSESRNIKRVCKKFIAEII